MYLNAQRNAMTSGTQPSLMLLTREAKQLADSESDQRAARTSSLTGVKRETAGRQ
jgi:hypothetical protein